MKGHDVVRMLQQVAEERGMPQMLFGTEKGGRSML
jgi:hypothetical protein